MDIPPIVKRSEKTIQGAYSDYLLRITNHGVQKLESKLSVGDREMTLKEMGYYWAYLTLCQKVIDYPASHDGEELENGAFWEAVTNTTRNAITTLIAFELSNLQNNMVPVGNDLMDFRVALRSIPNLLGKK